MKKAVVITEKVMPDLDYDFSYFRMLCTEEGIEVITNKKPLKIRSKDIVSIRYLKPEAPEQYGRNTALLSVLQIDLASGLGEIQLPLIYNEDVEPSFFSYLQRKYLCTLN